MWSQATTSGNFPQTLWLVPAKISFLVSGSGKPIYEAPGFQPGNRRVFQSISTGSYPVSTLPDEAADVAPVQGGQLHETTKCQASDRGLQLYGRSIAYIRLDLIDQAIADSTEAIRIQPDYYPAYMSRAECFYKKGDLKGAIADDTEAIRIQPNNAVAYRGRGQLYSQQGAHEQAIADFTEAIQLDPDNPQGYILRAKQYRKVGDASRATMDERTVKAIGK